MDLKGAEHDVKVHHVFCASILPMEFSVSLELKEDTSADPTKTLLIIRLTAHVTKRVPFQSVLSIVTSSASPQYYCLINKLRLLPLEFHCLR